LYGIIPDMTRERKLTIRIPDDELEILEAYCKQRLRNKTDVVREYIRSLAKKVSKSE
jgi:hypothetical protein